MRHCQHLPAKRRPSLAANCTQVECSPRRQLRSIATQRGVLVELVCGGAGWSRWAMMCCSNHQLLLLPAKWVRRIRTAVAAKVGDAATPHRRTHVRPTSTSKPKINAVFVSFYPEKPRPQEANGKTVTIAGFTLTCVRSTPPPPPRRVVDFPRCRSSRALVSPLLSLAGEPGARVLLLRLAWGRRAERSTTQSFRSPPPQPLN